MKSKAVVSAILMIAMTSAGFASAQGYGDRGDRGRNEQAQRDQRDHRGHDGRQANRRDDRDRRNDNYERRDERGGGPNHDWRRGGRLPAEYRHNMYVVDDWRGHRLSAPPRGYHWVQAGNDYVLVAIATGVILQLMLNH
ncbi:MAG: RcnB family protein [Sulfuritalea sp.]|jgi:Ni/Co efflux regulator RcnB|nr:RcnB family protein [Sulfuritalea sp.]